MYEEIPLEVYDKILGYISYESAVIHGNYRPEDLAKKLYKQYGTYSFLEYVFIRGEAKEMIFLPEEILDKLIAKIPFYYISKYLYLLPGYGKKYKDYFTFYILQNPTIGLENFIKKKGYFLKNPNVQVFDKEFAESISANPYLSDEYIEKHKKELDWNSLSRDHPIDEKFYKKFKDYLLPKEFKYNVDWTLSLFQEVKDKVSLRYVFQKFPLTNEFVKKYYDEKYDADIALNPSLTLKMFKDLKIHYQDYFQGEEKRNPEIIDYLHKKEIIGSHEFKLLIKHSPVDLEFFKKFENEFMEQQRIVFKYASVDILNYLKEKMELDLKVIGRYNTKITPRFLRDNIESLKPKEFWTRQSFGSRTFFITNLMSYNLFKQYINWKSNYANILK
jgi:hypothetical protein